MGWVQEWVNTTRFLWIREKQRTFRSLETQSRGKPAPLFIRSHNECACMCAKSLQLCSTLWDTMDCSPPDSSVHGILQARILEYLSCPPPGDLPNPGMEPGSPTLQADSLPSEPWITLIFFLISLGRSVKFHHELCLLKAFDMFFIRLWKLYSIWILLRVFKITNGR